ncbi:hypothetical protein [Trinickia acidisoli]|uniref:hypothetical protein n=1 Tax=Trinickia acidisoli TaxID=2767482 RepID=UPI001A8F5635|nr:hypothetical protein [Trinickia acidisoli]
MDRRTFMTVSLGVAAMGCAMPWFDCYGVLIDSPALLLVDSTLFHGSDYGRGRRIDYGREVAAVLGEVGARRIEVGVEVGNDVGTVWHEQLRGWPGAIKGALRPSDCFVLRNCSMADGRAFRSMTIGSRTDGRLMRGRAIAFAIDAALPAREANVSRGAGTHRHAG